MIPVGADSIKNDVLSRFASVAQVVFNLPDPNWAAESSADGCSRTKERHTWLNAFRKCSRDTHQLLSCPGSRRRVTTEKSKDTWRAVASLVGSGLPIPKSPSGNLPDILQAFHLQGKGSGRVDPEKGEREERGWWELRYQEVLGELLHAQADEAEQDTISSPSNIPHD